ncbi:MAG: DMT family transporter [Myxococcota bacterium]|nr:DMT family transporter [Myxococcota bacterium]
MELHRPSGRTGLGLALASSTMLLWGLLPLALQIPLRVLDPVTITWFRFGVSVLLLAAWLASRGELPVLGRLGRSGWLLLLVATGGLAANYLTYLLGLDRTSAANAQVLIQVAPLLLALGGIVVFRERFTRLQWIGLAILVAGLAGFFASQLRALAAGLDRYLSGVAMFVVAAVTWAGYGLAQKQLLYTLPSQPLMLLVYLGCFAVFSIGAAPAGILALDARHLIALGFCAINTLLAYGAFAAALEHWEASRVSAVLALTPLATLAFAALGHALLPSWVESETLLPGALGGAVAVVAGSALVALGRHGSSS